MFFKGKKILVTGAAGGIGLSAVHKFRQAGGIVAAADLNLDNVAADVCLPGDLIEPSYVNNLVGDAAQALGGLDIVINNAGIITRGPVTETTDIDFELSVAVNVKAPFILCRAAIPVLIANGGGAIVNTASCWGVHPGPDHAVYCMTKAALASLTQCMGRDHAVDGVRINAVCPNEVDTPMLRSGFERRGFDPESAVEKLGKTVPLGRIATPDDISDVILFLASDSARYICGELLEINGGKPVG